MSYILDALKKSEQERGHGNIPDVQTVHSSSLNYHNHKKTYWPYFLIVAVLLNLAAITYFIIDKGDNQTKVLATKNTSSSTVESSTHEPSLTTVIEKTNESKNVGNKPLPQQIKIIENPVVTVAEVKPLAEKPAMIKPQKTVEQSVSYTSNNIIDFNELPESTRRELPGIVISAHVYSSNPLQRSIVINNNFMEEGEYLIDGLVLYEITPEGAIFSYQGYLFNYGVVSSWQ